MKIKALYNMIIENIYAQCNEMIRKHNIEPNKIILGIEIANILMLNHGGHLYCEFINNNDMFVVGIPITVDLKHRYTIEVCYEIDKVDMTDLYNE